MGEESDKDKAETKKIVESLKAQIKELEKTIEEKKKRNDEEITAALKAVEIEEDKMNALKEEYEKQQAEANQLPASKDIESIKKKADESDKIVKFLKKEHNRLKQETEKMEEDLSKMRETNNRLIEANASAGASLETLNKQAKVLKEHNKKLEQSIEELKKGNKKLDHDLRGRQAYYEAETKIRADYEQAMEKIVKLMEDRCDDSELVEKVMTAQLTCLTNISGGK